MLTAVLNAAAKVLLYNFFFPFLTIPFYVALLIGIGPHVRAALWLKIAAAILVLPLLHGLVVLGSLLYMMLASKYTGVTYWAA